ncbi:GNAT family N-acetyltransferase [Niabella drilacis]|uniref:N-acetylglutamate synthase, GNAT family n=1 Tax=Niabella drilacis (strain DSM 25811 / CCM 8410 / CCUG 62505 / LMG 26954 / E90) TaxID=1285928 RepID=A0A1G6IJC0_NIADE|nr:GNAT family N-acetyltransferase [Niabella drilacis]SDC06510.1 N-acetylglutamate synthase, GNAT family [Niabella drilacis]
MFTIKELDNSYCNAITELILPIQQVEFNVPVTLESQPDLLDIETTYIRPGGNFWGAFSENVLVGTIALMHAGPIGAIRKMFVRKEHRGARPGIAGELLDTLIRYSRQQQLQALYLGTVEQLKAAQRFYEKNGFTRIAEAALPAVFPKMPVDNIFYYRTLKN